jgi:hypothetical protein
MRAVALAVSVSLLSGACFPHNPRARTYAKATEGAFLGAGIIMEALTNAGADCMVSTPGEPDSGCKDSASLYGGMGVVLILAGLLGFVATISTTPDDDDKPRQEIKAKPPAPVTEPVAAPPAPPAPPAPMPAAAPAPMPAAAPAPVAPMPAAGSGSAG